ncbi:hypothetical protein [Neisseria subflava]|uniref:hypothetical protein n=1 Tax=Neisseria subflava TaxID=28449 RepID=UPI00280AF11F|nr:hypothetical protein [Neisseria subflava]
MTALKHLKPLFWIAIIASICVTPIALMCRNQQCCLHFWLLLEDPFEQLSGIVKNVDRHGKPALFLIIPDSCLRIIQAKTKAVRRRKSVNNATISYNLCSPIHRFMMSMIFLTWLV